MKHNLEIKIMTTKLSVVALICCILGTAGCVTDKSYYQRQCENGICTSNQEYTAVCVENADGYSECTDAGDINYTTTAAGFRKYGERSPRDHRITQAGAGNNISAAIPPSIDDEVLEYENGVAMVQEDGTPFVPGMVPTKQRQIAQASDNSSGSKVKGKGKNKAGRKGVKRMVRDENGKLVPLSDSEYDDEYDDEEDGDEEDSKDSDSSNKDWLAEEGQSLKELLTLWSEEAGWRLIWKTNRNYTLNAGAMFRGNFADVASALVRAFARARPAPIATFYKGNRVLVIETMEDENAYD